MNYINLIYQLLILEFIHSILDGQLMISILSLYKSFTMENVDK